MTVSIEGMLEFLYELPSEEVVSEGLWVDIPSPVESPLDLATAIRFPAMDPPLDLAPAIEAHVAHVHGMTGIARVATPRTDAIAEWTATDADGHAGAVVLWTASPLRQVGVELGQTALGEITSLNTYKTVVIGSGASATGKESVAVGADAGSGSDGTVAVGNRIVIDEASTGATVLGRDASARNSQISTIVGNRAVVSDSAYSVAVGYSIDQLRAAGSVSVGHNADVVDSSQAIAIGSNSSVTNSVFGVALGYLAKVSSGSPRSMAIGVGATVPPNEPDTVVMGAKSLHIKPNPAIAGTWASEIVLQDPGGGPFIVSAVASPKTASGAANTSLTVTSAGDYSVSSASRTVSMLTPGSTRHVKGDVSLRMSGGANTAGQWGMMFYANGVSSFVGVRSTDIPTAVQVFNFTWSLPLLVGADGIVRVTPAVRWGVGTINVSWASATITVF